MNANDFAQNDQMVSTIEVATKTGAWLEYVSLPASQPQAVWEVEARLTRQGYTVRVKTHYGQV